MGSMFRLDDKFLEDLGLAALPAEQKKAFLQHIYSELEMRVGERLTEGMSDELLDEFGQFVDQNMDGMNKWFDENLPDYANRDDFKQLKEANSQAPEAAIMSEYGAMKWLQLNRPDYPQVVAAVLEEIKGEISANKDSILAGASGVANDKSSDSDGNSDDNQASGNDGDQASDDSSDDTEDTNNEENSSNEN
jgi:hypothetical protein